jgi:hypothetical protein
MLEDRPWHQVAEFAAYSCQVDALGLKPWQPPPCHVDPDHPEPGDETAAALLQRMLQNGVSRWDPDPMAALAAKEE